MSLSLPCFPEQMAAFYCRTHQEQEAHPKVDRNFLWDVSASLQRGIGCLPPPVATPAGISHPGSSSRGTAASQHVQQLFEEGIKACHKSLQPEAREECFHEASIGYEALGVQTAIK